MVLILQMLVHIMLAMSFLYVARQTNGGQMMILKPYTDREGTTCKLLWIRLVLGPALDSQTSKLEE